MLADGDPNQDMRLHGQNAPIVKAYQGFGLSELRLERQGLKTPMCCDLRQEVVVFILCIFTGI